jgi:hypothetical protein
VDGMALDLTHPMARVEFVPAAIEVLGDQAELDDQDAREVGSGRLASFLLPELQQGLLILAHNNPGVRAADELATVARYCGGAVCSRHSSAVHRIGVVNHLWLLHLAWLITLLM